MPSFSYVAINEAGKEISGVLDAADVAAAQRTIESQNLLPTKVEPSEAKKKAAKSSAISVGRKGKRKKISEREVIDFTRQLSTLLKAGVPILAALETLSGQAENPNFAEVLINVAEDIAGGEDFSAALGKYPKVFSDLYVSSIMAGEAGGVLDSILTRIADVMKRDAETKSKVKGALRYPIMVVSAMIVAFIVMVTMVVPKFADIFKQVGLELPIPTIILMALADFVLAYWWIALIGIGGLGFGFRWLIRTKTGGYWWDGLVLKMPIFGPLVLKAAMTRFTRMFETLSRAGLPILQIFNIVSRTLGNEVLSRALMKASEDVEHGRGVAVSLADTGFFPPLVVKMISVGEEAGALDEMLANIADFYEEEVRHSVEGMTALIEPILTLGMGGMVLLLMLAIFLPMWDMMQLADK